jgi:hypothetical protein
LQQESVGDSQHPWRFSTVIKPIPCSAQGASAHFSGLLKGGVGEGHQRRATSNQKEHVNA